MPGYVCAKAVEPMSKL